MPQKTSSRWIAFLILVMVMQIAASYPGYKLEFLEDHFLVEGIFQVQVLNLESSPPQFLVSGKNYTGRDMYFYLLSIGPDRKPVINWQSDNLFEDRSILGITVGRFTTPDMQILAVSKTKLYLYRFEMEKPLLTFQGVHEINPLNIASGDVNGDGKDELITVVIGQVTSTIYNCRVQVWKFENNKLEILAQSGLLGNIRSLTVGDLDTDGTAEILVEEGIRTETGNIHVLKITSDNQFREIFCLKKATKSASYGMKIRSFPGGTRLIAATANGKIDFFNWSNQQLISIGPELSFSSGLIDADAIDLDGDNLPELLVVCYPQRFLILNNLGGMN